MDDQLEQPKRRTIDTILIIAIIAVVGAFAGYLFMQHRDRGAAKIEADGVQFLDFYADWCGPCRTQAPIIEQLKTEYPAVRFVQIDVDEQSALSDTYGIKAIPTLVIVTNGQEQRRFVGLQNIGTLTAELSKYASPR